jgi:regulator of sigma E protease
MNIEIPREYVPKMLKGKGQIETRIPFGPFVIESFGKKSPSKTAGVLIKDQLVGIDDRKFTYYDEFQKYLSENKGHPVILNILRNETTQNISVTTDSIGALGIGRSVILSQIFDLKTIKYGFLKSIPAGIAKGMKTITDYLKQFKLIFSRHTKGYESLGGFITIGSIFPGVWDWQRFWDLTAFLSIILAVMNILPIPALDGGHVLFLLFEVVTGKKPSDKFLEYAQIAGMILLLALLLYANGNDVVRMIRNKF